MTAARYITVVACCAALIALTTGCEEDVASPSGVEGPFSLNGIINPRLETQTLLVSPIEDLLKPLHSLIDAVVISQDRTSGHE